MLQALALGEREPRQKGGESMQLAPEKSPCLLANLSLRTNLFYQLYEDPKTWYLDVEYRMIAGSFILILADLLLD
jgi:hypothetical protein